MVVLINFKPIASKMIKKEREFLTQSVSFEVQKNHPFLMTNITLFSQIISKLDRSKFNKLVKEKQSDKHQKGYSSWTHLVSMLFCQFAKSQSVRDISNGLRSATGNLNHLGINRAPSQSNKPKHNEIVVESKIKILLFILNFTCLK